MYWRLFYIVLWAVSAMLQNSNFLSTVNVGIFAQYIFSRISCMALGVRQYDVSGNLNHYTSNRINLLYARKFVYAEMPHGARCAKI